MLEEEIYECPDCGEETPDGSLCPDCEMELGR